MSELDFERVRQMVFITRCAKTRKGTIEADQLGRVATEFRLATLASFMTRPIEVPNARNGLVKLANSPKICSV